MQPARYLRNIRLRSRTACSSQRFHPARGRKRVIRVRKSMQDSRIIRSEGDPRPNSRSHREACGVLVVPDGGRARGVRVGDASTCWGRRGCVLRRKPPSSDADRGVIVLQDGPPLAGRGSEASYPSKAVDPGTVVLLAQGHRCGGSKVPGVIAEGVVGRGSGVGHGAPEKGRREAAWARNEKEIRRVEGRCLWIQKPISQA